MYTNEHRFLIGSVYIPPDSKKEMNSFLSVLDKILTTEDIPVKLQGILMQAISYGLEILPMLLEISFMITLLLQF